MFGPVRGPWTDHEWTGEWGDEPPYHHLVFVLTHHPRPPVEMGGGTTFHFVVDGIESALQHAFDAAGGNDVRIGGGASTIQLNGEPFDQLGAGLHCRVDQKRVEHGPAWAISMDVVLIVGLPPSVRRLHSFRSFC